MIVHVHALSMCMYIVFYNMHVFPWNVHLYALCFAGLDQCACTFIALVHGVFFCNLFGF